MELWQNIKSHSTSKYNFYVQPFLYMAIKRIIDIVVSLTLLLLFIPILLLISHRIYKKEGKPIFFRQTRIGRNNHPFIMLTFRTKTNPSKLIHAFPPYPIPKSWEGGIPNKAFLQRNDYTIMTPTGLWLRKYRLHKIPLLLHVLNGEMSLVGPEAEIPEIVRCYNSYQAKRLKVKPGMTGYAQLNNHSNNNHNKKIADDLYYIKNRSNLLDIKLIFRTLTKTKNTGKIQAK